MNRLLCITVSIFLLITAFSGCDSKNDAEKIENLITAAFELNEKLNDLDLSSITTNYYDYGTTNISTEKKSELKVHNVNNPKRYEMSEITTQKISSSPNLNSYEEYYKDGYYYTTFYGGAFKSKLSAKEAGIDNVGSLVNIKYSDMRSVGFKTENDSESETKWGKGYTAITFTCKNSALKKFMGRAAEDNNENYDEVDIKSGEGEYIINADGYLVYESLQVTSSVLLDGNEVNTKISVEITYNDIGKEVDPYNPEDNDYVEVDKMDDVIGIHSATLNTLSADDLVIQMDAETEILQGEKNVGYNQTYIRQQDMTGSEYAQKSVTTYFSDGKSGSQFESSQYYTDGRYYQRSDMYEQNLYCVMDFSKFVSGIYNNIAISPASIYSTDMMQNIKSSKTDDGVVYNFGLNSNSRDGLIFLSTIVGPYEDDFRGNFSTAEIKVNSFDGKMYVDTRGYNYKIEVSCDVLVKFEEGDVAMKFKQTVNINEINGNVNCTFPDFSKVNYERMELSELLGAMNGSDSSNE